MKALVACESGSIRLTVRRSIEEMDFTFELDDCVSEGWTQDGDIEISWDDSLVDSTKTLGLVGRSVRLPLTTRKPVQAGVSPAIPARFNVIGL